MFTVLTSSSYSIATAVFAAPISVMQPGDAATKAPLSAIDELGSSAGAASAHSDVLHPSLLVTRQPSHAQKRELQPREIEPNSEGRVESIQTRMISDSPLGEVISKALGQQTDLSHAEAMPFPTRLGSKATSSAQAQVHQHAHLPSTSAVMDHSIAWSGFIVSSPNRSQDTIDYAGLFNADIDTTLINEVHSVMRHPESPSDSLSGSNQASQSGDEASGGLAPPRTRTSAIRHTHSERLERGLEQTPVSPKQPRNPDPARIEEVKRRKREREQAFRDVLAPDERADLNKRNHLLRKQKRLFEFSQEDQDELNRLQKRVAGARERIKSGQTSQPVETLSTFKPKAYIRGESQKIRRRERDRAVRDALTQQERSDKAKRDRLYKLRKHLRERNQEFPDKKQRELDDLQASLSKARRRARQELEAKQPGAAIIDSL